MIKQAGRLQRLRALPSMLSHLRACPALRIRHIAAVFQNGQEAELDDDLSQKDHYRANSFLNSLSQ